MAFFNVVICLTTLSQINLASCNEASSISASVYNKVRYRVRDIVGMLQSIQQRVTKDGEEDAELFSKYMFYCQKGRKSLEEAINEAEKTDFEKLKSTIQGEEEKRKGIQNAIEELVEEEQAKKVDSEASIQKAKSLRDEESAHFKKESNQLRKDIQTMTSMIMGFEHGDGLEGVRHHIGVPILKELSGCMETKQKDRDFLKQFLQKVKDGEDVPDKEELHVYIYTTKLLKAKIAYLEGEEETEIDAFRDFQHTVRYSTSALRSDIKAKTAEVKELEEEMNSQKEDLSDAARYLMEGRAFLPFISASENCSHRQVEWKERCHMRTAELGTLIETVSTLTDDDFLDELFQKGLPRPWQEGAHHAALASKQSDKSIEEPESLLSLALKGKNASFAKLFKVFDGMAAMLGKEQHGHPEKFCGQSMNQTENNLKTLTLTVSNLGGIIARHEKSIATLTEEIEETQANIDKIEKQVLDTGRIRKQEHEDNSEVLTINNMTLQLFGIAKERLQTFYSKENAVNPDIEGVTLGEVIGPYVKKREDSASIVTMLETTTAELRYEMAKVEEQEKQNQEEWEQSIKDSIQDHAREMQAVADKQAEKAQIEATRSSVDKEKTEKMQEVKETSIYLSELQGKGKQSIFLKPVVCSKKSDPAAKQNKTETMLPILPKHIPMLW